MNHHTQLPQVWTEITSRKTGIFMQIPLRGSPNIFSSGPSHMEAKDVSPPKLEFSPDCANPFWQTDFANA
jgi:hypothetical protein